MSTRELRTRGGFLLPALLPLLFLAVPVFARSGDYYGPLYTSSEQIEAAQRILQGEKDLKPGGYTVGQMDQATIDAIRTFQRDHFIPNSGLLDHETFAQLETHASAAVVTRAAADGPPARSARKDSGLAVPATSAGVQDLGREHATLRTMPSTASPIPLMTGLGALLAGGGLLLMRRKRA